MKHKEKKKIGRKLRTKKELKDRVPIFNTAGWNQRKESIRKRVNKIKDVMRWEEIKPVVSVKKSWWQKILQWLKRK